MNKTTESDDRENMRRPPLKDLNLKRITPRELATVLAALRYWQENGGGGRFTEYFADHQPLTPNEIDALCERLNRVGAK